jgi:phage-related minor tail protein
MAGQNAARLAVQLALESGTFSQDVTRASEEFRKLPALIRRESAKASKDMEAMEYAAKNFGKEITNVARVTRELYGEYGKYKNAAKDDPNMAKNMLKIAESLDKAAEAQKRLNVEKMKGIPSHLQAALSYQTTDIVTSLAGGQNPMLVLLQQGGQLRDQFGGIGPLFMAIAGAITLVKVGVVALAAGIGTLAYSLYYGNKELKEFNNELLLSGNLANQTYDKYINQSQNLAEAQVLSIKNAKQVFSAVSTSGQFTQKNIESVTNAIAAFARTAGVSGTEAAQKLIPAFDGSASSALQLTKAYNFLNLEQVKTILNADKVVDRNKIIKITTEAFTDAVEKSKSTLGYFERLSNSISNIFEKLKQWGAEDKRKDLREMTNEISDLTIKLNILNGTLYSNGKPIPRIIDNKGNADPLLDATYKRQFEKIEALKKRAYDLNQELKAEDERLAKQAAKGAEVQDYLAKLGRSGGPGAADEKRFEIRKQEILEEFRLQSLGVSELTKIRLEADRDVALAELEERKNNQKEAGGFYAGLNAQIREKEVGRIRAEQAQKTQDYITKKGSEKELEAAKIVEDIKFQSAVVGLDRFKRIDLQATRDIEIEKATIQKLNKEEHNAWTIENEKILNANILRITKKAESDKAEISRQAYEEVRKNIQDQQNLVNLDKEKLAIYEKNLFISEADYKIALLKLDTEQQIQKIRDNPNLSREDELKAIQMQMELQKSKIAVNQLDERLKLLKDSGALVFKSLEDAIIQFTRTGKLSFKDLVGTVLRGLLEMQIRAQSTKLFSMLGSMLFATPRADLIGANAVLGTNQSLDSFDFPQRAMGGSVAANDSYIVGENGPEMFVPRQSGTIIPNSQLSSMGNQPQVIYNGPYIASMSAIDTQSATQFLARNKNAVWSANQSAARGLPTSR